MNKSKLNKFILFLLIFAFFVPVANVNVNSASAENETFEISAKSALLVDYDSGKVILEKNSNEKLPIASMTKLASLAVIFDYLDKGIIKQNDMVSVSETAASVGGSSAFLDYGSRYKVCDLIKSVIIASANDSTVALAEYVCGTEDAFVLKMNKYAQKLELKNTNFSNSTGLPSENHYSTAEDMVKIYKSMCNNSLYKSYSKIWIDELVHPSGRKTGLVNTNRLVKTFDGVDGGKTGYTDKAKFCLTASATRGDTKLVGVIIGAENSKIRFSEMSKMLNYGFANFETKKIVDSEIPVTINKFKNAKNIISIFPEKDINVFLSKTETLECTTDFELYDLKAPVKKGAIVGKMFVFDKNNMVVDEVNLIAGESALEIGFSDSFEKIIHKW